MRYWDGQAEAYDRRAAAFERRYFRVVERERFSAGIIERVHAERSAGPA